MLERTVVIVSVLLALAGCSGSSSEKETCNDGVDNDDNGLVDCADPACGVGALCGPHGLTCAADQTCSACSGNGGTSQAAETICGDGLDNDCDGRIDCDDPDCQAAADRAGGICDALGHRCSAPDYLGHGTCTGAVSGPGGTAALGAIRFVEADSYVLGTRGSGHQEQAILSFGVTRQDGAPYGDLIVSFDHLSQGGSFIGADPAACTTVAPRTCATTAVTDSNGRAQVLLTSGRTYASLEVRATATVQGVSRSITAGGFTVVGAKPNGAHLSLDCNVHNIPALTHQDCVYSNFCGTIDPEAGPGAVRCTAKLADRFGVAVGFPARVELRAEAGAVPPVILSKAYDVTAAGQTDVGHAPGYLEFCNSPLPLDVGPLPGEASIAGMDWGCGLTTVNPRDGLVTLVAMVPGEEGFVDLDGDGTYDEGEPFVDLPEPFVDANDDGVWEPGEWYLDVDGNGAYSGPNGRWDSDTILWTQTRLLYTGYPVAASRGSDQLFTRFLDPALAASLPGATPAVHEPVVVSSLAPASLELWFTDRNLNPLTSSAAYALASTTGRVQAVLTGPFGTADSIGASFRQLFCAGEVLDASCREGPIEQGCTTSPCHVVWDVALCRTGACRFQYGDPAGVALACASPGADVVNATADVAGVRATFSLGAVCTP